MNIKIKQINLHYFKGIKELSVDFNETTTSIFGENATGKTTVFDAFTWLLFGKNSQWQADSKFDIKTYDEDGNEIPKVEHEVSAILLIDGEELKLKRVYREKWEKKRGELLATFTGNTTDFYFDEVPVSAAEYAKRINDLLNENLFKLITNPAYFNSLDWKERRNILTSMAGNVSNDIIVQFNPQFQTLIESLSGKSIEDIKAKITQQRKTIKEQIDFIPTRVDEVRRGMPEKDDYAAIEKQIGSLTNEIEQIDTQIADKSKAMQAVYEEINRKRAEVNALKTKQSDVLFKAREEERNRVQKANADIIEKESQFRNETAKLQNLQRELQISENNFSIQSNLDNLRKQRENKIAEWHNENEQEFTPNADTLICPIFKHKCADTTALKSFAENNEKAVAAFNQEKIIKLESITRDGLKLKEQIESFEVQMKAKKENELSIKAEIEEQQKVVDKLKTELDGKQPKQAFEIDAESIPEWVEFDKQIKSIETQIEEPARFDNEKLIELKREISSEINRLSASINTKEQIEKAEKRIDELKEEEQKLAQQLADFEKTEYEILEFTKAKMAEVNKRVNGMFSYVKFRLFETQINGAEVECCETLINTNGSWVPYSTGGNTAGRMNAGIDIINAICAKNNVRAPIFIDNRESVNEIIPSNSQIINLIVSSDKKLTVK